MDIERSLKKGGRLQGDYSSEQLKRLADEIAVINNVRFFDNNQPRG
jgi:hypothetical protein